MPIAKKSIALFGGTLFLFALFFIVKISLLQIVHGEEYKIKSEQNRLDHTILFTERGIIYDRTGIQLAWNESSDLSTSTLVAASSTPSRGDTFPKRVYIGEPGFAHILGFVNYPKKDKFGNYFQYATEGRDGVEKIYDEILRGVPGKKIVEEDALGKQISESTIEPPVSGEPLTLSVDARIQEVLYESIADLAGEVDFLGGAGVILDVRNGEVIALTSFPSYDSQVMTDGQDDDMITQYTTSSQTPFLNRAIGGLYTPGSIMKPFVALGALAQNTINPLTTIYSDGALEVPNRFNPGNPTVFKDWKAHGAVDMRRALAVSSNIYFFHVGGGFGSQKGIGIEGIEKFTRLFGIPDKTDIDLLGEKEGIIPNIEWKEKNFPGDPWRIGDTYNSSIGQYGFQVTPIQMARAAAAIANNGTLITPHLRKEVRTASRPININKVDLQIIREGMRMAVTEGTAVALNIPQVQIAAKSGTAELGSSKQRVNSWIIGFWPYESPKYAFAVVMEKGPARNIIGSAYVMRRVFDQIVTNAPEYLK